VRPPRRRVLYVETESKEGAEPEPEATGAGDEWVCVCVVGTNEEEMGGEKCRWRMRRMLV
jgi:hypothetical protein